MDLCAESKTLRAVMDKLAVVIKRQWKCRTEAEPLSS